MESKVELVKFQDGSYGIRKSEENSYQFLSIFYYYSFNDFAFTTTRDARKYPREECEEILKEYRAKQALEADMGEPV